MSFNKDNKGAGAGARDDTGLNTVSRSDMTRGPILSKLLSLAAPMVGAQVVQMLYNMTDMFWLGRLGNGPVASSGAVGMYMWLSVSFMMFGSMGAGIGVSQSVGRGDRERAKAFANAAMTLSVALGALYGAVMIIFNRQMIGFFAFRELDVANDARKYLVIVSAAIPITYLSSTLSSTFTASGNSRIPFACNLVGMSLNIVLDPVLIFAAGLGITGAAVATAFGQCVVCTMLIIMMKSHKNRPFEKIRILTVPRLEDVRQLFKWAAPTCLESFLFTFLAMTTTRREAFFGANVVSIARVGSQIESLTWMVGGAFGSALVTFIGQNFGAKRWDRIKETFRVAMLVMFGYGVFVSMLMFFLGRQIFMLFLPDPTLTERAVLYMKILAVAQIPMCIEGAVSNSFRGLGRTIPPAIVNTSCNVLRVIFVYTISATALGVNGIWVGVTISHIIKGVWAYAWYALADIRRRRANAEAPAS